MSSKILRDFVNLESKNILLGVSGGIAAYKSPALVRLLRAAKASVQVVTTTSAQQFVTNTTLQSVSGRPVRDNLWDSSAEAAMGHIELARWADLIIVAPATANLLSDLATGRAGSLLTTLCLASEAPIVIAPAMNRIMWEHPATQENIKKLKGRGAIILGPDDGEQACGEIGPGRMREPEAILADLKTLISPKTASSRQKLEAKKIVITAGPTREPIDPVRYISNHSSGKQGYELAVAAKDLGANVTLISGPANLPAPIGVKLINVVTAQEMCAEVEKQLHDCDIFIGVAAVADYRPSSVSPKKIKKDGTRKGSQISLTLEENPDIIAYVAKSARRPITIGFAAETDSAEKNARKKLKEKGLDAIIVNNVATNGIGFNSDENAATLIWKEGKTRYKKQSKAILSIRIMQKIEKLFFSEIALSETKRKIG